MRLRAIFAVALGLTLANAHSHAESPLLGPQVKVAGKSQAQWSAEWWQWAGSFDRDESPVADRTGARCGAGQTGPVWFLAGTYGTRRTVRSCTVPSGKHLFFPLINYVVMPRADGVATCASVTRGAALMTEDVSSLILDINGESSPRLATHRQATRECFDMGLRSPGQPKVFPSAANGYYVMLRPLPPGTHTINFGGALPGILQAVTYTLTVE